MNCLIHWFRHDLRMHDLPSLSCAMKKCSALYPIYIVDENDLKNNDLCYNRLRFILEALKDIDNYLKEFGGRLYVFCGDPLKILCELIGKWKVTHLSYEDDIQPIWTETEASIKQLCKEKNIEVITKVSHTLWDPRDILKANRGQPPVTYSVFCQVAESLGPPPKPECALNFKDITLPNDDIDRSTLPSEPEELGVRVQSEKQNKKVWTGGEKFALQRLENRLKVEKNAYEGGTFMPNQVQPDLLNPSMSLSAALSLGCLSVRKFYWDLLNLYSSDAFVFDADSFAGQLFWREYFYTMCINNPYYGTMQENPICLSIAWKADEHKLKCWTEGKTGFPFIDAAMRQMHEEGWVHHVARNAVACFLTRGDLWISWEDGFKVFMKYMIDADYAVCAGNWMWVSSSAFENILQCSACVSPITYGRRFDRFGEYVKKFVPELKDFPTKYIFEPWLAPQSIQEAANCIIGKDYPHPIVNHSEASAKNMERMNSIKSSFLSNAVPMHCSPSNNDEIRGFMWLPETCIKGE